MILIVTARDDEPASRVETLLRERRAEVDRFDAADFPAQASVSTTFANGASARMLRVDGRTVALDDVGVIWLRRPGSIAAPDRIADPAMRDFVTEHCRDFMAALWDQCDCNWLPGPLRVMRYAQQKGVQLRCAAALGFEIPPTVLTNDPQVFLDFYRAQNGHVVSKLAGRMEFSVPPGEEFSRYTEVVTNRDVGYAADIACCPMIFQAYVPKRLELRITIVGSQVFAAEIHSQASNRTRHDWRRYDNASTPYRVHELPAKVAERCSALLHEYDLLFGTIDMILTPDGRYVFLELNPNGEYLWIEEMTGLPISRAIAEQLIACAAAPTAKTAGSRKSV